MMSKITRYFLYAQLFSLLFILTSCGPTYKVSVLDTPETQNLKGHQKPYIVNGKVYMPLSGCSGFAEEGVASWYGKDFHGRKTSNGEVYDMYAMTAAHKTLPLGVSIKVRNLSNGKETVVRVNDRGPFVKERIVDLSYAAAKELGVVGPGTAPVRIEVIGQDKDTENVEVRAFEGSFEIQVAAFSVEENARHLQEDLKGRFGKANIYEEWVDGKTFYRVRAGGYATIEEAMNALTLMEESGFSNCFIVAKE